jgi:hypothetical protein
MKDPSRNNPVLFSHKNSKTKNAAIVNEYKKIQHLEILYTCTDYVRFLEDFKQEVLTQKTRTIRLLGKKTRAQIIHTLLGYEVQASYKRIQCPDLVTARYIRLFSELGFHSIPLPYDPTLTARLIPKFESTLDSITDKIRELFPNNCSLQSYVTRKVFAIIRAQIGSQ